MGKRIAKEEEENKQQGNSTAVVAQRPSCVVDHVSEREIGSHWSKSCEAWLQSLRVRSLSSPIELKAMQLFLLCQRTPSNELVAHLIEMVFRLPRSVLYTLRAVLAVSFLAGRSLMMFRGGNVAKARSRPA